MLYVILFAVILSDQFSKLFFSQVLILGEPLVVVKGFFYLTLVHNRGGAFGILKGWLPLFFLISLFTIGIVWKALEKEKARMFSAYSCALSLIVAGGIGNLIDRVRFGYVVDFLDFRVWPVFNIADSAITIGAILLGWQVLKAPKTGGALKCGSKEGF